MTIKKYITKTAPGWHEHSNSLKVNDSWVGRSNEKTGNKTLLLCRSDPNLSGEMEEAFIRLSLYLGRKEARKNPQNKPGIRTVKKQ